MGEQANGVLKRRGLLAGAATLAGAGLAKLAGPGRAEATHDGSANVHVGVNNAVASAKTGLFVNVPGGNVPGLLVVMSTDNFYLTPRTSNLDAIQGSTPNGNAAGVFGTSTAGGFGVLGVSDNSRTSLATPGFGVKGVSGGEGPGSGPAGVWGTASATNGVTGTSTNVSGVFGVAGGLGPGLGPPAGVAGTSVARYGVLGTSRDNVGVSGLSTNSNAIVGTSTNWSGVIGIAGALGPGLGAPYGVVGTSVASVGVLGSSASNVGCFGLSNTNYGVVGTSTDTAGVLGNSTQGSGVFGTSPVYGMWGRATGTGAGSIGVRGDAAGAGIGVYGTAGPGGFAGYFNGPVFIKGVGVLGTSGPQAASAQAAQTQTIEAFGGAKLENGQATVTLDEATATAIGGGEYHVVVTEVGDAGGLFLASQGSRSFEVRARKPGASNAFHYRVVARGMPASRRTAEAAPAIAIPKDIPVPTVPELPKAEPTRSEGGPERQRQPDAR